MAELDKPFAELPTNTYQVKNGRIIGKIDGIEAMEQLIEKTLETERFEYVIYTGYFGTELLELFGQPFSFAKGEVKRRIKEALLIDSRILSVDNFEVTGYKEGIMYLSFSAQTIFGEIRVERGVRIND